MTAATVEASQSGYNAEVMRLAALAAGAILFLGAPGAALAAEPLPSDAVRVEFKEPVGDRYVGVLNLVMGTTTLKRHSPQAYTFRVGDTGNQNDFALFFAHLPYVRKVEPLPRYAAGDLPAPGVVLGLPANGQPALNTRSQVPGQLLVKPKPGADPAALQRFHASQNARVKEQIPGIDVWLIELPPGLTVAEAQRRYAASGLVQYAEPNRMMGLPDASGATVFVSPDRLFGDHLLLRFRAGGPTPELVSLVYGTRMFGLTDADQARVSLPPQTTPLLAQRLFRLCPHVAHAEPAYGR